MSRDHAAMRAPARRAAEFEHGADFHRAAALGRDAALDHSAELDHGPEFDRPAEAEIGTEPAQTRALPAGIVAVEGGGTDPHPLGGGVRRGARRIRAAAAPSTGARR